MLLSVYIFMFCILVTVRIYLSYLSHTAFTSPKAICFPLSSHSSLLQSLRTCGSECETNRVQQPFLIIFIIVASLFALKAASPTERTSSSINNSGYIRQDIKKERRENIPDEYCLKALFSNSVSSAYSSISLYFSVTNSFV